MQAEGLESLFARHQRLNATRAAIKGLNLPLFAADSVASPAITAVAPDRVEADQIRAILKSNSDLCLGGQDHLKIKSSGLGIGSSAIAISWRDRFSGSSLARTGL